MYVREYINVFNKSIKIFKATTDNNISKGKYAHQHLGHLQYLQTAWKEFGYQ